MPNPPHGGAEGIRDVRSTANHLRRSAAGLAGAACLLLVGACGTNFEAQTNQIYQPAIGANESNDQIKLLNVLGVANDDDTATLSASIYNKTTEDDVVTAVTGTDGEGNSIEVELVEPIELPAQDLVATGEEAQVVVSFDEMTAGYYVTLDFEFENASPVEVDVPIVTRDEEGVYDGAYDEIAEAPAENSNSR